MSEIKFKDKEAKAAWVEYVKLNDDPYGGACVMAAKKVMEWIDENNPKTLVMKDINEAVLYKGGLTGFMVGAVASMVSQCHARGEEYRVMWNGDYGIEPEDDKGGVVNPALVTINMKDEK